MKQTNFLEPQLTEAMIDGNYSSLKITIKIGATYWISNKTLSITCNSVTKTADFNAHPGEVVSKTFTFDNIQHESNGTKTVSWSWSINTGLETISDSGTKSLQLILRASKPTTSSSVNLGSSITINTNRMNTSLTHTITFTIDNTTGTIGTNVGDSVSWTPSTSLGSLFPNSLNQNAIITCYTYYGEDLIGTETTNITLKVPNTASSKPTMSLTLSEDGDTPSNWGIWVQNKSKVKFDISASGKYGATIVSDSSGVMVEGKVYHGLSITTDYIQSSSSATYLATATDSRGLYKDTSGTITIYEYNDPVIEIAQAKRVNSNNVEDDLGTFLNISFKASITELNNKNTNIFRVGYRVKDSGTSFTYKTLVNDDKTNYSIDYSNYRITDWTLGTNDVYEIVFEVIDTFRQLNPVIATRYVDTGFDLLNFHESGKAMAIGQVSGASSNEELLEVNLPTKFYKNVLVNGENVYDELFYSAGDVIEMGDTNTQFYVASGYVTSGKTMLTITINLPKSLKNITSIAVNNLIVEARSTNGYINSQSGFNEYVGDSNYTITANKTIGHDKAILIIITKNSEFTNVDNNRPITLNGKFKFTLS